jgi:hypothetical protein
MRDVLRRGLVDADLLRNCNGHQDPTKYQLRTGRQTIFSRVSESLDTGMPVVVCLSDMGGQNLHLTDSRQPPLRVHWQPRIVPAVLTRHCGRVSPIISRFAAHRDWGPVSDRSRPNRETGVPDSRIRPNRETGDPFPVSRPNRESGERRELGISETVTVATVTQRSCSRHVLGARGRNTIRIRPLAFVCH